MRKINGEKGYEDSLDMRSENQKLYFWFLDQVGIFVEENIELWCLVEDVDNLRVYSLCIKQNDWRYDVYSICYFLF